MRLVRLRAWFFCVLVRAALFEVGFFAVSFLARFALFVEFAFLRPDVFGLLDFFFLFFLAAIGAV